jgi:hypothetical protein
MPRNMAAKPDAILLGDPQPARGHEAIRQTLSAMLADASGELLWRVNFHEINGDIAVTYADYRRVQVRRRTG